MELTDAITFDLVMAMIFAACASFCTAVGLLLMKIGIIKGESTYKSPLDLLQRPWWPMGLIFLLLAQLLNGGKYNLIPNTKSKIFFIHYFLSNSIFATLYPDFKLIQFPLVNLNTYLCLICYSGSKIWECIINVSNFKFYYYLYGNFISDNPW